MEIMPYIAVIGVGLFFILLIRVVLFVFRKLGMIKEQANEEGSRRRLAEGFLLFASFIFFWELWTMLVFHDQGFFSWIPALFCTYLISIPYRIVNEKRNKQSR